MSRAGPAVPLPEAGAPGRAGAPNEDGPETGVAERPSPLAVPGGLRPGLAAELERFVELDALVDPPALGTLVRRLEAEAAETGCRLPYELSRVFRGLLLRLDQGPLPLAARRDLEAAIYPRLWKVLEAVDEALPAGEQRVRIEVTNRRLARLLVAEERAFDESSPEVPGPGPAGDTPALHPVTP